MINVYILINESKEFRQFHIDLTEPCLERGGNSTNHKGVLAQYLNTNIPYKTVFLCHACHNGKCSNPKHLYWGTPKENIEDSIANGTYKRPIITQEIRDKISKTKKYKAYLRKTERDKNLHPSFKGEKNSQYRSIWITNGKENRKIKDIEIIPEGFKRGRIVKRCQNNKLFSS